MGRYGKGMRDCCDSPAQRNQDHVKGCPSVLVPLDEARLREFPINDPTNPLHRLGDDLAEGRIKDLAVSSDVAYALKRIAELENALSAERERGDRAVIPVASPLEREKFYSVVIEALDRAFDAGSEYSQSHRSLDEAEKILSALATQKAEGAHD